MAKILQFYPNYGNHSKIKDSKVFGKWQLSNFGYEVKNVANRSPKIIIFGNFICQIFENAKFSEVKIPKNWKI